MAHPITDDEAALLGDISDDVYGLWEVDWWFNGRLAEFDADQRIAFLSNVVKREIIDVFFGAMGADLAPLPLNVALDAIRDWENWQPREPVQQPVYHVMTNHAGMAALRAFMAKR